MSQNATWAITVYRDADAILTIETNCISGRQLTDEDVAIVRKAAHHLLAFIGDRVPDDA